MIAVTGANGFVGSAVVKYLHEQKRPVVGVMRRTGNPARLQGIDRAIRYSGLDDLKSLHAALKGCKAVVHCAARSLDWGPRQAFHRTNVEGTANLVEASAAAGVSRVVLMSSANVAGYGVEPLEEKAQVRVPSFSYSRSKIQAEAAAARLCTRHNLKLIILRPSAVYGPEDWKWSFEMIHRLDRTAWPLVNRGQARFTPVYIGNLTSAVALALDTNHEGTYNLTDDVTVSWLEFCEKIARALGKPARVKSFPFAIAWPLAALAEVYGAAFSRKSGPPLTRYRVIRSSRDFLYSCRLACDELGYRPDRDLDKHIRRTVQWYREVLH